MAKAKTKITVKLLGNFRFDNKDYIGKEVEAAAAAGDAQALELIQALVEIGSGMIEVVNEE
jgi:hypothetical protein